MRRTFTLGVAVAFGIGFAFADPARAATAYFEVDSFSFFYFEGAGIGGAISGTRIPIQVTRQSVGSWRIEIAPEDLVLPEMTYPSGKRAVWRLSSPAVGSLDRLDGAYRCDLSVPAVAFVDGGETGIPMTFQFTTESTSAEAAGVIASREGSRLDPRSGQVQLVAAGVNPTHAASAPGKPFYVVLSGRFTGIEL
jgi:hypothetical protein